MTKKPLSGIAPIKKGGEGASIQAFPAWGRGTASAVDRVLSYAAQMRLSFPVLPAVFHSMSALSAPAGHLPLEGKAAIRECPLLKRQRCRRPMRPSAPQAPSSRAQPRDLYCTAAICTHAPSLKRHLGASFSPFPHPRFTGLQKDPSTSVGMTFKETDSLT